MKSIYKKILLFTLVMVSILLVRNKVYANASVNISAPTNATVGENCEIKITGSGAATYDIIANISGAGISEKIYLNAYTDDLQNGTKTASKTIVPTSTGTITISIDSSSNVTVSGASSSQKISGTSKTITVSEEQKNQETSTPTTPTTETPTTSETPTTQKQTTTTTKTNTKTKTNTSTNTSTTKQTTEEDNFYITKIVLQGIKENGEKEEILLSPEFNKSTYEYTCQIASDIQKIEIEKDAGNYTNNIVVTGNEELAEGENVITLMLSAEDHQAKTYTIKVIKEKEENVETIAELEEIKQEEAENDKQENKTAMISMPMWLFVIMQVIIIVVEVLIIYFVLRKMVTK